MQIKKKLKIITTGSRPVKKRVSIQPPLLPFLFDPDPNHLPISSVHISLCISMTHLLFQTFF